ncbi:MAG: TetR/AcrR family transcriptional regulator, partial [bacterium]
SGQNMKFPFRELTRHSSELFIYTSLVGFHKTQSNNVYTKILIVQVENFATCTIRIAAPKYNNLDRTPMANYTVSKYLLTGEKMSPTSVHSLRKQEIIESARKIISTTGMKNLTIREIAQDINLTDGAVYRHFKNKEEILSLLIDDIDTTLLKAVAEATKKGGTLRERLKNTLLLHLSYTEQRKGISFIIINETLSLKNLSLQKKDV